MSLRLVEKVADALLYEGYMLYPYRPSSVKNRQRFNFGVVYPGGSDASAHEGADSHRMRTACLVEGDARTVLDIKVRFLQLVQRTVGRLTDPQLHADFAALRDHVPVDVLQVGERTLQPWQEALERAIIAPPVSLGVLVAANRRVPVTFAASETLEPVRESTGATVGVIVRRQCTLNVELELSARELVAGLFQISVQIHNLSPWARAPEAGRDELLLQSLVSVHTILSVTAGAFVSLLDPPDAHREAAAACQGIRSWPVLIGEAGQRDTMLSSPIILYDYPLIAEESAGDLFDGTEIDEILSLRILTMTDAEKGEMRQSDARARLLLERTESLNAEDLMRMHGVMRAVHPARAESA